MTTALLIIDVQRALCTGEEAAFDIDRVLEKINAVGAKARSAGDYDVILVADAHSTVGNGVISATQITAHHNTTLANMTSFASQIAVTLADEVGIEA